MTGVSGVIVMKPSEYCVETGYGITPAYLALGAVEGVTVGNLRILMLRKATRAPWSWRMIGPVSVLKNSVGSSNFVPLVSAFLLATSFDHSLPGALSMTRSTVLVLFSQHWRCPRPRLNGARRIRVLFHSPIFLVKA